MVRLISCLPDSNRNLAGEYVRVSGNWLNGELTCPTSPRQIGQYFSFPRFPNIHKSCIPPLCFISMLIVIYFTSILCRYISLFLLLLSPHITNLYPLSNCSFQEISTGYKRNASPGAQLCPLLRDICALHKLPRFVERLDSQQPSIVIPGHSTTWIPATRAHFQGSQVFRSPIG